MIFEYEQANRQNNSKPDFIFKKPDPPKTPKENKPLPQRRKRLSKLSRQDNTSRQDQESSIDNRKEDYLIPVAENEEVEERKQDYSCDGPRVKFTREFPAELRSGIREGGNIYVDEVERVGGV